MQDTDTGYRYQTGNFNTGGSNNEEEMDDDIPTVSYEEMEVNAPVLPPKPNSRAPPKKPNVNTLDN